MQPIGHLFWNRLRRRLAFITNLLRNLRGELVPRVLEIRSQRMCPFCGLITSRHKLACLECGKTFKPA
jgi:uncharacterized protein YceH (UPF0502 family)